MIVPRNRAILGTALLGGGLALAAAIWPAFTPFAWALAAVIAGIAVTDAWLAKKRIHHFRITAPTLLRVIRGRGFGIPVTVENHGTAMPRELSAALHLPSLLTMPVTQAEQFLAGPNSKITSEQDVLCHRRGEYKIQAATLQLRSELGLWDAHHQVALDTTVKVYPDLFADPAAAEFLDRRDAGSKVRRFDGKGREFEKLREYLPGDSFDEIDWKATARRGKPVVRVFRVEQTQEIYVALDASRLSGRLAGDEVTLERYVNAALVMALAAESQGDKFGLISFSDQIHGFVSATRGKSHFKVCRELIYQLQPRAVEPDFAEFFAFLQNRVPRRALVIVLTSLDDPLAAETFARHVAGAAKRHLVIAAMPQPEGAKPLFQEEVQDIAAMYESLGGHLRWRTLAGVRANCRRKGVNLHFLDPDKLTGQLAGIYLDVKRRQQL